MHWHSMYKRNQRYVLLDRDGVINRRITGGYVTSWEQFEFLPRALEALRLLNESGYSVVVVSNQACVGKGLLSATELESITRRFLLEVALSGGHIVDVYYCRHQTEDRCNCRKPRPGLLVRAQTEHRFIPEETYLIGDSPSDMFAAEAAGCPSILIQRGAFLGSPARNEDSLLVTSNLYDAAEMIIAMQSMRGTEHDLARRSNGA
jgi:D-glycero-D-manno-heptose 1,7-bisphosphate phosphatase